MMRRLKLVFLIAGFSILSLVLTLRVAAVTVSNSECNASGGCTFPCVNGSSGTSSQIISASQTAHCSPAYGSNCPSGGGSDSVCGVFYHYTGADCDAATIDDSYYVYSYSCAGS
jgi:hypothetical protein